MAINTVNVNELIKGLVCTALCGNLGEEDIFCNGQVNIGFSQCLYLWHWSLPLLLTSMCGFCQCSQSSFSICAHKLSPICLGYASFRPITKTQDSVSTSRLNGKRVPKEFLCPRSQAIPPTASAVIKYFSLEFWLQVPGKLLNRRPCDSEFSHTTSCRLLCMHSRGS